MPTATPDLWPADIFTAPRVTPIAVLRQQGDALGARTHNFVLGDTETKPLTGGKGFEHTLYLSAPLLRYREPLVRVEQPQLDPYPANVVETDLTKPAGDRYWNAQVHDENELRDRLREFFNEARVKDIVRSINNLSNDVAPLDGE